MPAFISPTRLPTTPKPSKKILCRRNKPRLEKLRDAFAHAPAFNSESLEAALKETAKDAGP